jgi:hypothetical protein
LRQNHKKPARNEPKSVSGNAHSTGSQVKDGQETPIVHNPPSNQIASTRSQKNALVEMRAKNRMQGMALDAGS